MSRKKLWAAAAVLAVLLVWLFQNASLARLRRNGGAAGEAEGIEALRAWAWKDVDSVALVSFDVEGKPEIERRKEKEKEKDFLERREVRGTAVFVVDGFRADGARVERAARVAFVLPNSDAQGEDFSVSLLSSEADRIEPHPRFHDATLAAGLGAPP